MGSHSEVNEHEVKAVLIEKLKPLYAPNSGSVIERVIRKGMEIISGGHHGNINVDNYNHKDASSYSQRQQVGRTIAALKKIKEFNHDYFSGSELRILNPANTGLVPEVMRLGFAGVDAVLFAFMWRSWSFNTKSLALFGGLVACQVVALHAPNFVNECIQFPRRRMLAQKYIDQYGYDYFHKILDPRYDLHELHHLKNDLNY